MKNIGRNDAAYNTHTAPNPEADRGTSLLGKLVVHPNADQKHVLTF